MGWPWGLGWRYRGFLRAAFLELGFCCRLSCVVQVRVLGPFFRRQGDSQCRRGLDLLHLINQGVTRYVQCTQMWLKVRNLGAERRMSNWLPLSSLSAGLPWTHASAETPRCESPSVSSGGFRPGWVDGVPRMEGQTLWKRLSSSQLATALSLLFLRFIKNLLGLLGPALGLWRHLFGMQKCTSSSENSAVAGACLIFD